jgi:hypothetical protein
VAETENIERVLQAAHKANDGRPVRFWTKDEQGQRKELKAWIYASPYYDDQRGVFRMWSRVLPDGKQMRYGYSESKDGIDFDFISELKGIVSNGDYNSVVTIDLHEADPAHRYKIGYDGAQPPHANGACLAHSADGIHWTQYNGGKPVTGRAADFTNCLIWDEQARLYRLLTRTDFGSAGGLGEIRGMRVMTNSDVKKDPTAWKTTSEWQFDRKKDEFQRRQIYTLTDWMYCGIHFGLMAVYEWPSDFSEGKETDHRQRHERDVLNYYLVTSRDGDRWDLRWVDAGQPLVERGQDGAWDKDMILPANWIVTRGDEHWIYYGGANERHGVAEVFSPQRDAAIGLAKLPLDRFVALEAKETLGEVVTKPFVWDGTKLLVNVAAKEGEISVELLDDRGEPLAGFAGDNRATAKKIDELDWRVPWENADELRGRKVKLKFQLRNARLYAFDVR